MSVETEVQALTTSTTNLTAAVAVQQSAVNASVLAFQAITDKVNNDLNNVDNTSDADKPISTLQQSAINSKQETLISGSNLSTINGLSILSGNDLIIERSPTSLTSLAYENIGSLRTPSTPLPIADDSLIIEGLGQFMYVDTLLEPDDDETCFTAVHPDTGVEIGQWLLRIPAYEWTAAHNILPDSILREWMDDEYLRFEQHHN